MPKFPACTWKRNSNEEQGDEDEEEEEEEEEIPMSFSIL
jgi:hypothetical protein